MTKKKIIWLASYPKSGNTWLRIFLENLLKGRSEPVDINKLALVTNAAGRDTLESVIGIELSDLSKDEIEHLRPEIYETIAANSENVLFIKIHDAYTFINSGKPLVPTNATFGAIYIIRNPLDIVVSYAHHNSKDVDHIISIMADKDKSLANSENGIRKQIKQNLLTWSQHIKSWVDMKAFPVHIVRYEDMKNTPTQTFKKIVKFTNLNRTVKQIQKAIEFSRFELLHQQELKHGFREKSIKSASFFRKGEVGSWRESLDERQLKRIIKDHKEMMIRFGYIDPNGQTI